MARPTMFYRAPQDGDDVVESMDGPVAYIVVDLDEQDPPSGWFATYPEALGAAPKKRGRPRKEETPSEVTEPDGDGN